MKVPFNIVGVFASSKYVGYAPTLEEAMKIGEAYKHYGFFVTFQRGWHIPPSRECLNGMATFPSSSDIENYCDSLIYKDGVIFHL